MKNFFKKLAFVLALAMVVTAIAPAAQASAAAQPTLNATSKKIYIDGDYTGKYSDTFTLKVWNKGDYRVTFASSDTKIATVTKWYGVVTAKAVGTATITATVSNKTTGKVIKTLSSKVYVKKNADSVKFGSLAKFDQPLVVGDKVKINVARVAGTVTAWKQADKTQISDYTLWTSSNPEVATVDKWGTVKAIAAGETTISAVAMQTEGTVATTAPATVKVTVVAKGITSVTQKTTTKLEVVFGAEQDTTKVTKDTLTITPADASKGTPLVKEVKWNDAKTVATVEVYVAFQDKAVYTVKVKDTDSVKDFTASNGEVASITVTKPGTVVVGEAGVIEYVLKDANGIELNKDNSKVQVEVIDGSLNGYVSVNDKGANTVNVYEKGKTISIKLIYHTFEYNNEGVEKTFESNAFVVTGIDKSDATIASTTKVTVVKGDYAKANFDKVNTQITLNDNEYAIEAYVKDSTGTEYKTNAAGIHNFTFESLDPSKVVVDANGNLWPVAVGTAVIKVKITAIDKEFIVQINVAAEAKPSALSFDNYNAVVSNKASVDEKFTVKATIKDQYGNDISKPLGIEYGVNNTLNASSYVSIDGNKVTFSAKNAPEGNYSFKLTVGDLARVINVTVKTPDAAVVRKGLVLSNQSVDMARNNDNSGAVAVTVEYFGYDKNGLKNEKYDVNSDYTIEITNPKNVVVATGSSFDIVSVSGKAITKLDKTGTYTVSIISKNSDLGKVGTVIAKMGLNVADNQVKPVLKQDATTIDSANPTSAFSVSTSNNTDVKIIEVHGYKVVAGSKNEGVLLTSVSSGTYVITKIKVQETYGNGNYYVHTLDVNRTLNVK